MILPYLLSYGLLTPEQQEHLTHLAYTSSAKKQELCNILLRLDESNVKSFYSVYLKLVIMSLINNSWRRYNVSIY